MSLKSRSRCGLASAFAASVLLMMSLPAWAQKVAPQVKRACAGDYKRLCPTYKVGSPQLRACMEAKQNSLSTGCVSALIDSGEASRSARR